MAPTIRPATAADAPKWLETQGAVNLTLTRLTLEDLFVALVKEKETAE